MAKPLEIDIAANTRKFQAGVQDAEAELRDFSNILSDFADDSKKIEDAGEDAFDATGDAAKKAEGRIRDLTSETKDTKREFNRAEDAVDDLGRSAKDAGDDAKRAMDRASEGAEDFKNEAQQSAREAAASFRGEMDDITDIAQEIAANAFGGFGPAGAAAGLVAAGGIGLAISAFESFNEQNEESKARAAEWASAYMEAGGRVLDATQLVAAAQSILSDPEAYEQATQNAENWGVSVSTAVAAMTGQQWALDEAQDNVTQGLQEQAETLADVTYDEAGSSVQILTSAWQQGQDSLDQLTGEMEAGAAAADAYSGYLVDLATNTEGATQTVDEFGDSVYALPDGTTIYIDAETGQATTNVDAIERRIFGPGGINGQTATIGVQTGTVNSYTLDSFLRSNPTITVAVHARTMRGISIPI